KLTDMVDRFVVDGIVNLVGLVSLGGGEGLKYSNTGQTQFYMFTVLLGVGILGIIVTWQYWGNQFLEMMF
ncbi:MAG: NAD(P)H-quinone oxidoreductase subunit F, partial [Rivularia sp. (in: cyanobacteria)]